MEQPILDKNSREYKNTQLRKWRVEHPERTKTLAKKHNLAWRKKHPMYYPRYIKKWNNDYPAKRLAEHVAETYLKIGPDCEFCGDTKSLVLHHPDYCYPLITVTCCKSCHKWIHNDLPADYYTPPAVDRKFCHCDTCRKKIGECGKKRPAFRGRGCMIWEGRS